MDKTISFDVNKEMQPNTTIQLMGNIILNTKGLSKTSIIQLNPTINGINVISEQSILIK
jgi:hypothetical protein